MSSKAKTQATFFSFVLISLVLLVAVRPGQANLANGAGAPAEQQTLPAAPNCRYGVAAWPDQVDWLDDLGAGWFHDFNHRHTEPFGPAEYYLNVIVKQQKDEQGNRLDAYLAVPYLTDQVGGLGWWIGQAPGAIWIIGNEPDRGPDPGQIASPQGDVMPELYARAYHDIQAFIKARDPSALVANAGLVEVTPGRLHYLDLVWDKYLTEYGRAMPVDIWNMHLYILPEATPSGANNGIATIALGTNPALAIRESGGLAANCGREDVYCYAEHDDLAIFAQQVRAMRGWMRAHGQQQKPLILSEYSILYPYELPEGGCFKDEYGECFDPGRIAKFMNDSFAYLESAVDPQLGLAADGYRLVQQWGWYSVETNGVGKASNLVEAGNLTAIGQAYQAQVAGQAGGLNLLADEPAPIISPSGTISLTAAVRNNGTLRAGEPFSVTFYSDAGLSQVIGAVGIAGPGVDFPGLTGCATRPLKAAVAWTGLAPGVHEYWIAVDSGGDIAETDEGDNVVRGLVWIAAEQVRLPVVFRK